jgi:microcystin-dependent protein
VSQPYVGELRMFGGNFAPAGWAFCNGQLVPISQNETLFQVIGTTYGGDGQNTFGLPDLRGRRPVHQGLSLNGTSYPIGQAGGVETVTLTLNQVPVHTHAPQAVAEAGSLSAPAGATWAQWSNNPYALSGSPTVQMAGNALGATGGGQPHDNLPPYLAVSYIISLFGIFPSQN